MQTSSNSLLSVRISVDYPAKPFVLRDAEFEVRPAEIVGLVGQSGCGKSTIALAILRLLDFTGGRARGEIIFRGRDLMRLRQPEMCRIRGREIALVLQSPLTALNPALRIGTQMAEAWRAHQGAASGLKKEFLLDQLALAGLPAEPAFLNRYPKQLSVGQAQRVLIAMAVMHRPALLIADEPTSALDTIAQADILALFARLNRELDMGILYISHDLLSVAALCHRVAILREGEVVEFDKTECVFRNPAHPYTRRLVEAIAGLKSGPGAFCLREECA
jgi:ABC-type dipeptide/oligopeptide/nickel transport system ATPase component